MQIMIMLAIALSAVLVTFLYRRRRDTEDLTSRVTGRGGQVVRLARVSKGHPFADTGRGWWVWRIDWREGADERRSWALTTREGIREWRD